MSPTSNNEESTTNVVYYPNEEGNGEAPQVASPRLRSLEKKIECARDYAARLALLIHARSCIREASCPVKHCTVAQGVLRHCQECSASKCHASCRQAKILLQHFRVCRKKNVNRPCLLCSILKRDYFGYLLSDAKQRKFKAAPARSLVSKNTSLVPAVRPFLQPLALGQKAE